MPKNRGIYRVEPVRIEPVRLKSSCSGGDESATRSRSQTDGSLHGLKNKCWTGGSFCFYDNSIRETESTILEGIIHLFWK